ncbi:MAG: tRNA 2-thiouridine(34) synthase MnmA [Candidatus Paceibacterota bacterium]|jgi:tRNA-specific 2-thiouridylase
MQEVRGKKIFVGLSGGVDSAVSAALLKQAGAEVTGVFIKGWYPPDMPCTWAAERRDAMRVAARLRIPFRTLDASAEYKKSVIEYLIKEYRAGRTPNPDVMCNKEVKFGAFFRYAMEQGADAIAMGHYRAGEKDQSYFLWAVPREILGTTLFPVGRMGKSEVRTLAQKFDLPVADKKDSQGVCFLGSVSVEEFLRAEFGEARGQAIDESGVLAGEHDGVFLYTIGERVALHDMRETGPWFVLAKDLERNELIVGRSRLPSVAAPHTVRFSAANWLLDPSSATSAQCRYRGARVSGQIQGEQFVADIPFSELPTPGQSIVFYRDAALVGGGTIEG